MRAANTLGDRQVYDWAFVGLNQGVVTSSSQLNILTDCAIADAPQFDYLFVIASYDYDIHDTPATRRALAKVATTCKIMIGLDTGAWLMASAGLLEHQRATVHWDILDSFSERFLNVEPLRERVVRDDNRITCAGATSAYDLTRELICDHIGHGVALDVDALFMRRDNLRPRHIGSGPSGPVQRAIDLMHRNIETPMMLDEISRQVACPPKTLSRRFQAALGATPGQVYRHIRLSAARHLVDTSSLQITEIAVRTGYESPAALTRAFRKRFGHSPRGSSVIDPR
jgi:transcriptional regulator GlxA family with amidase domain